MKVINIHKRIVNQPKEKVSQLFKTLATTEDLVWPYENWPAMKFKNGLKIGSKGGHGRVRYTILDYIEGEYIKFQFSKPLGFIGIHELKVYGIDHNKTELVHKIDANISIKASFLWLFIIRWLHDALIEDAFDKVENHFLDEKKITSHNLWVKLLRGVYKKKRASKTNLIENKQEY
jgi:hypothetical protein